MRIAANANARPSVGAVAAPDSLSGAMSNGMPDPANGGADAAQFAADVGSLDGASALRPTVRAASSVPEPSKLEQLSSHFKDRVVRHVAAMDRAITTRDFDGMVRLAANGMDMSVQSEFTAKVLGKTISAVDAITKLN